MASPERKQPLAGLHVLVVDDDMHVRDMVTMMLEHAGARVTGCANGPQALDALRAALPDVMVMDINLPGPSGLSVMRTIRRLDDVGARAVPAIAVSGYGEQFGLDVIKEAGFTECLSKPVALGDFVGAVARVAGRPA
jgi:two-component system CheB/CheR fusion protein